MPIIGNSLVLRPCYNINIIIIIIIKHITAYEVNAIIMY